MSSQNLQAPATTGGGLGSWGRFWFTPADPTVLGMLRFFAGLTVLYVHLAYTPDLQRFFGADAWLNRSIANEMRREAPTIEPQSSWRINAPTPTANLDQDPQAAAYVQKWGIHPDLTYAQGTAAWSIWFHVDNPTTMWAVHLAALFVMFLFTVGFCTRITSVLTWVAALCYIHRSPVTLFGMDAMMSLLLLYLAIGPSGAALSVDRWLVRRGYRWFGLLGWGDYHAEANVTPLVGANFAIRLLQVHYAFIYAAAGTSKLLGGAWWNGTALWWVIANPEFTPIANPNYLAALVWLCDHRWLWELLLSAGVVFTLGLQLSFPFLVWMRRWRWLLVSAAVLLHSIIGAAMGLVGFGLLMLALALAFIPPEAVRELLDRRPAKKPQPGAEGPERKPEALAA